MEIKVPTLEEYQNHTGLHYHRLWRLVGENWICPACKRTKFEIMRWSKRFPGRPNAFMDWVAPLHEHHDHSVPLLGSGARFENTIICDQCNSCDGSAKRMLKLPKYFSFSPQEINRFVVAIPHGKHQINLELAKLIYDELAMNSRLETPRFFGY